jgi:cell shape-determining protein MreC
MDFLPKDIENIILNYKQNLDSYDNEISELREKILLNKKNKEKLIKIEKNKKKLKKIFLISTTPIWAPILLTLWLLAQSL